MLVVAVGGELTFLYHNNKAVDLCSIEKPSVCCAGRNETEKKIAVTIALIAGGVLAAAIFVMQSAGNAASPAINPNCLSLNYVELIQHDLKQPTYLPAGYEYKCWMAGVGEVSLLYWNQSLDRASDQHNVEDMVRIRMGSILFRTAYDSSITNSTKAIMDEYHALNSTSLKPQLIDINGKLVWGHEAVESGGTQTAKFPDGRDHKYV